VSDEKRAEIESLFQQAADLEPAHRSAFLDEHCRGDAELRREIETLLDCLANGKVASLSAVEAFDRIESDLVGRRIGPYRLLELIGEGGFGAVYMAGQEEPIRRKVAFKIIKLGMDTRQVIARFEAERQALAMMDHPNIAKVLDAGATDTGRPYFVMELVKGIPITEYCDDANLSVQARLELFMQVCHAVQHAHQKGIIHRDIKPNNVLVTLHDGTPVPKVIDFGIAKATEKRLTEKTLFTEFRQVMGTPEYMSPEQASLSGLDIDTRSDIYALGVLLYVLLTGKTPFDPAHMRRAAYEEVQRIIREEDPPTPSQRVSRLGEDLAGVAASRMITPQNLCRTMRGDLDWIVMKALDKDRTRRYDTAAGMARDIERHLNNEAVMAGPPSALYTLTKFVRRHRVGVLASTLTAAALVIGLSIAIYAFVQATQARDAAEQARVGERLHREEAESVSRYLMDMLASVDPNRALGREVTVRYVLDEAAQSVNDGAFRDQPLAEANVHLTIGNTYKALGLYDAAAEHLEAAVKILVSELGASHADALRARSALAGLMNLQGRYTEAEFIFRKILEAQRASLGEEHPDTLTTMNGLGISLWRQDEFTEAEKVHRGALEIEQRVYGSDHVETMRSLVNLGTVLMGQNRLGEAEKLLRRVVETDSRLLGEDHPDTQKAVNNLALALERQGRFAEAEGLYRRALEADRRVLGDEHPGTQIPLNNLLRVLEMQGKKEECEPLVALKIDVLRRAAEQPGAGALPLNEYAWHLLTAVPESLRDPEIALRCARKAVDLAGPSSSNYLDTLALALARNDDIDGAIQTQWEAVRQLESGRSKSSTGLGMRLFEYLWIKGDLDGMEEALHFGEARDLWQFDPEVKNFIRLQLGGKKLIEKDRFADASSAVRSGLAMVKDADAPAGLVLSEIRTLLGMALSDLGRFEEAEALLLQGYEGLLRSDEVKKAHLAEVLKRIVALYTALGQEEKAQEWRDVLCALR
jgi:serine/threonine protein kinase/tetratricopeptide (TPR) repeat protein